MTIQDFASIAHILAAAGIIGTLIVVLLQIKPNARLFRIQQRATRVAGLEAYKQRVLQPEFAKLLLRAQQSYHELEPHEKLTIEYYYEMAVPSIMSIYIYADVSSVNARESADFARQNMRALMDTPGAREWWAERRGIAVVGGPAIKVIDDLIGADGKKDSPRSTRPQAAAA